LSHSKDGETSADVGWERSVQHSLGRSSRALALLAILSIVWVAGWIIYQRSIRTTSDLTDGQLVENWTVDLNHATEQELRLIPGLGPKLARAILQRRSELGPFQSLDQLSEVPGIKEQRVRNLARYLKVSNSVNGSQVNPLSE
jgi:competence protein ComEA